MGLLDFENQLIFYAKYHKNKWNRYIHMVSIPLIWWSTMMLLGRLPVLMLSNRLAISIPYTGTFAFVLYFALLDPIAALAALPIYASLTYSACKLATFFTHTSWIVAVGVQALAWALQVGAHRFLEKQRSAFLQSLLDSFLIAPFFVLLEVLFMFGYRPALQRRIHAQIDNPRSQGQKKTQ